MTNYINIETRIHKDDLFSFKTTEKAINVKIAFNHSEFGGDCFVYVWVPNWALERDGKYYSLKVTERMNVFRVWNKETNKSIELTRDEFKKCVEMN